MKDAHIAVRLHLYGADLEPREVTHNIGLEPYSSYPRGEVYKSPVSGYRS